jgi:DNA-damage-inducible protein J
MAAIQINIDDSEKAAVDSLFRNLGIDTSTAVKMFFMASLENNGFPFAIKNEPEAVSETRPRTEMFGCLRGQYTMSDDFDAPLEDFREYME